MMISNGAGGCECELCGAIFVGQEHENFCKPCERKMAEELHKDEMRAEWEAEMRKDAYGLPHD